MQPLAGWWLTPACSNLIAAAHRQPAHSSPPLLQLQEHCWQLAPFMLSSTEKRRYLAL